VAEKEVASYACVGVFGAMLLASALAALFVTRGTRGRWGTAARYRDGVRAGPYRSVRLREDRDRPAPLSLWLAPPLCAVWGWITLLVFCPMGAFFLLSSGYGLCMGEGVTCAFDGDFHRALFCLDALLVTGGVPLAMGLIGEGFTMVQRERDTLYVPRWLAGATIVHQLGALLFSVALFWSHREAQAAWIFALVCTFGIALGAFLARAAGDAERALAAAGTE
jgi:hypothetical protein